MKKKILSTIFLMTVAGSIFACKPTKKKNNSKVPKSTVSVAFGVHPERGKEENAPEVFVATIYEPIGTDKTGEKNSFKTYIYEMDKLTPENLDTAFKELGIITEDSLFVDYKEEEAQGNFQSAGPGAPTGSVLTKVGTVRYVNEYAGRELYSELFNYADYEDKEDKTGLIDVDSVIDAICKTYQENYQLIDCEFSSANMNDFYQAHPDLKPAETKAN